MKNTTIHKPGFMITDHKGVRISFANGWAISVQWGLTNYCENYDSSLFSLNEMKKPNESPCWASVNAEVAIFKPGGSWYRITEHDTVLGNQTPDDVAKWITKIVNHTDLLLQDEHEAEWRTE